MVQELNKLIRGHSLISDQIDRDSLLVVLESLFNVLSAGIEGDIVELGCYRGTTSLFIKRVLELNKAWPTREFHVYDSFQGLPEKTIEDSSAVGSHFKSGELMTSKKEFILEFKKAHLELPIIHKGWFSNLRDNDLPSKIAFAFLDGDFYESIMSSLKLTWPKLSKGGVLCIDDYKREALPGVERAANDYFGVEVNIIKRANIGVIFKN